MRILISVPTFENIMPDTFKSIYDMDKCGHEVLFEFVRGYDVATARNRIVQKALDLNAAYVLMVDNDVVLPRETLQWMLEDVKDICLGYYPHRGNDNQYNGRSCLCKLYDEKGTKYFNYPLESEYTDKELLAMIANGNTKIVIHGGGMGCAFINVDLFRRISYPWYDWVNYPGKNRGMLSEDLYFCEQCRKAKIPIYADVRVSCGHMLRQVAYMERGDK